MRRGGGGQATVARRVVRLASEGATVPATVSLPASEMGWEMDGVTDDEDVRIGDGRVEGAVVVVVVVFW